MAATFSNVLVGNTSSIGATNSTASWTPDGTSQALLSIVTYASTGSANPSQPTVTGNGLTWTFLGSATGDTAGTDRTAQFLFAAPAGGSAGAITITWGTTRPTKATWVVDKVAAADSGLGSGTLPQPLVSAVSSNANPTVNLGSALQSGSVTYAAAQFESTAGTVAAGSGFTALGLQQPATNGNVSVVTEWESPGVQTGITATNTTTSNRHSIIAIEVAAAASNTTSSGSAALPRRGLAGTVTEAETGSGGAALPRRGLSGTATVPLTISNSFEGGTNGTAVSVANSGGSSGTAWDSLGSSSSPTYSATGAIHGSLCAAVALSGVSTNNMEWKAAAASLFNSSSVPWYLRGYFQITSLPPVLAFLMKAQDDVTPQDVWGIGLTTAGNLVIRNRVAGTNLATSTGTVALNTPARWEAQASFNGSTHSITLRIFFGTNVEGTTPDETLGPVTMSASNVVDLIAFGIQTATVQTWSTVYHDDIAASNAGWIGPVSGGSTTSSGGLALRKRGLAGAATETETSSGGAALRHRGLSGTAQVANTVASGGLARKHPGLAGTAAETETATGGLARRHPGLAGAITETEKASGGLARRHPGLSGAITETEKSSGGAALRRRGLSGAATVTVPGGSSGGLALPHRGLAGSVTETEKATGGAARRHPGLAGTVTQTEKSSGGAALRRRGLSGTATEIHTAAGGLARRHPALAGSATAEQIVSGGAALGRRGLAGQGQVASVVAAGGLARPRSALAGTGNVPFTVSPSEISAGSPQSSWSAGQPQAAWSASEPQSGWSAGTPSAAWSAGLPLTGWSAGPPYTEES